MNFAIPNILTIVRLFLSPLLGFILVLYPNSLGAKLALLIFLFSALTDFFDGYLARLLNKESKFGKLLDPVADKALIIISLISIIILKKDDHLLIFFTLAAILIIFREIFIMGLREFLADKKNILDVSKLAKIKTFFQMSSIMLILFSETDFLNIYFFNYFVCFFLWIACGLTLYTGVDYFRSSIKFLKD